MWSTIGGIRADVRSAGPCGVATAVAPTPQSTRQASSRIGNPPAAYGIRNGRDICVTLSLTGGRHVEPTFDSAAGRDRDRCGLRGAPLRDQRGRLRHGGRRRTIGRGGGGRRDVL